LPKKKLKVKVKVKVKAKTTNQRMGMRIFTDFLYKEFNLLR